MVVKLSPSREGEQGIALVSAYARPMDREAVPRICKVLSALPQQCNVILLGDLNARYAEDGAANPTLERNRQLAEMALEFGLRRLQSAGPTTVKGSAVDHCFVDPRFDATWEPVYECIANSDHFPVVLQARRPCSVETVPSSRCWRHWRVAERREQITAKLSRRRSAASKGTAESAGLGACISSLLTACIGYWNRRSASSRKRPGP